jgi:HD-GYP domain-containing protein (c-di-GMP phosphodiesterase class II)
LPKGLAGEEIVLPIRIANLANMAAGRHRIAGVEDSIKVVCGFSGTEFDPALTEQWREAAPEVLSHIDAESQWDQVVAGQPAGRGPLTEGELDDACELLADYADLKSPWFIGHSRGVAALAVAAGEQAGLPQTDLVTLRRAALLHDLGRNGVANTIWDKPGPLTDTELEKVRLHSYYTDRVLRRAGKLSALASVASAAHERASGSGYPRGVAGQTIPALGRVLAAADMYEAMLEGRPHRPARTRAEASAELRRAARDGELDGAAVDAVLAAAGHPTRKRPSAAAGLTAREVEVLVAAARGATTKAMAASLGIAPKTVGNHIERIYTKIGVSTRAEAAMFAMRHGLVPTISET